DQEDGDDRGHAVIPERTSQDDETTTRPASTEANPFARTGSWRTIAHREPRRRRLALLVRRRRRSRAHARRAEEPPRPLVRPERRDRRLHPEGVRRRDRGRSARRARRLARDDARAPRARRRA